MLEPGRLQHFEHVLHASDEVVVQPDETTWVSQAGCTITILVLSLFTHRRGICSTEFVAMYPASFRERGSVPRFRVCPLACEMKADLVGPSLDHLRLILGRVLGGVVARQAYCAM